MKHLVSIIMATYNRDQFIEETLRSIQKQTYTNFECLIIDDGGTDNTKEILVNFLQQDSRFNYLKRPNSYAKGPSGSRNYGLELAQGDYIIFFDDDDIVHPQNLETCIKELENKEYDYCRYLRTTFTGAFDYKFNLDDVYSTFEIIGKRDIGKLLTHQLPFNCCAIMWKKECFERHQFNEDLVYAEEWELYSRILADGYNGISINKILFYGRKHPDSSTGEFWQGNSIRLNSKTEAAKCIISYLDKKELLNQKLIHFFSWESVQLKSQGLLKHLLKQESLNTSQKLKARLRYVFSPLIKKGMRLKKKFK